MVSLINNSLRQRPHQSLPLPQTLPPTYLTQATLHLPYQQRHLQYQGMQFHKSPINQASAVTTFAFLNIQGLCSLTKLSSVPYLRDILIIENHIFLGLTETWLSPNHKKAELEIEGYQLFRKDRDRAKAKQGRYSGGVTFYIRDDIAPLFEPLLEYSNG